MMSFMMIGIFATMPASQALAGVIIDASIERLFLGAGVGLVLAALVAASRPEVREFGASRADVRALRQVPTSLPATDPA